MAHAAAPVSPAPDAPLAGIACLVGGVIVFVFQDIIVKNLSGAYPVHEMLTIRSAIGIWPLLAIVALRQGFGGFRWHAAALLRGFVHFWSYTVYYLALAVLTLADTVTLYYANPLIITALSGPFLRETVGWRRWAAVFVGFAGVVVVMQPGGSRFDPAMLLGLLAAALYGIGMLITRRAASTVPTSAFAISSMLVMGVCAGLSGLIVGSGWLDAVDHGSARLLLRAWVVPTWHDLFLMALCGPIAAAAFLLLSQAYRVAPASVVTPFEYSSLPVAVVIGYLAWGEIPVLTTWLGLALIMGAGLYIVHRETVRGRARSRSRVP